MGTVFNRTLPFLHELTLKHRLTVLLILLDQRLKYQELENYSLSIEFILTISVL